MARESNSIRAAHTTRGRRRRLVLALGALLLSIAAAGCGSGGSGSGSTQESTASAAASAAPNTDQSAERSIQVGVEYTGGKKGKADSDLPPLGIGWANANGGALGQPWATRSVEAAIEFVNNELGGVHGRPLELIQGSECDLGASAQQGTLCAQALLNNPDVKVILAQSVGPGAQSFNSTAVGNGRVPFVSAVPLDPSDITAKNTYFMAGGPLGLPALATFQASNLKAKTSAQIWPDDPSLSGFLKGYKTLLKSKGIEPSVALFPPGAPDVTSAVAAAQPGSQDAVQTMPFSPSQCTAIYKALTSLQVSTPVLGTGQCLDPSVKKQLGDFPKWLYFSPEPNPNIEDPSGRVGATVWALKKYDADHWEADIQSSQDQAYFGLVLTIAKWLNQIVPKDIDLKSFDAVAKAFHGPAWGGGAKVEFGKAPAPALGSNSERFSEYLGDGKWKYRSGWIAAAVPGA